VSDQGIVVVTHDDEPLIRDIDPELLRAEEMADGPGGQGEKDWREPSLFADTDGSGPARGSGQTD
jgi:hypothetical protein